LKESVALGQELGDMDLLATSLHLLAGLAEGQGDAERSKDLKEQSRALYRELEADRHTTESLHGLADSSHGEENARPATVPMKPLPVFGAFQRDHALGLAFEARNWGDYRHAVRVLEAVLAEALEMGDRRYAAYPRAALGMMARELGDYKQATALYEETLAVFQEVGDVWGAGSSLIGLSDVARDQGDAQRVIEFAEPSLRLFRKVGDPWFTGYSLHNLGLAARYQGDYGRSEALLAEALAFFTKLRGEGSIAELLASVGLLALEQGDDRRAEQALTESLRIAKRIGLRWVLGTLLEGMAGVAIGKGRAERAARLFGAAEAVRTAIGTPIWQANQALYERHIGAARLVLEKEQFIVAWQEGRALTTDEAIAAALGAGAP
jgi:tetratricopeptide (TPR) repeat protein